MRRNQAISQGTSAAHRAIQSGDHPSGGTGVDLSEGK
jgi:type IV secretion system protein TrbL